VQLHGQSGVLLKVTIQDGGRPPYWNYLSFVLYFPVRTNVNGTV